MKTLKKCNKRTYTKILKKETVLKVKIKTMQASLLFVMVVSMNSVFAQTRGNHLPNEDENFQVYSDCFNARREIGKKLEMKTVQYEADVEEYKKGRFCYDCKRTASQIERQTNMTFDEHIQQTPHKTVTTATKEMYDELYRKYLSDWSPLKKQYDQMYIDCQGKVKTAETDFDHAIKIFDSNYNRINDYIATLANPQEKSEAQKKLANYRSSFLTLKNAAQQNVSKFNTDRLVDNVTDLKRINGSILDLIYDYKNAIPTAIVTNQSKPTNEITTPEKRQSDINLQQSPALIQTQNRQAMADDYLSKAQDPSITVTTRALYLNQAKTYAAAAGNTAQVAEITRMQNHANQTDLSTALASTFNSISNSGMSDEAQMYAYLGIAGAGVIGSVAALAGPKFLSSAGMIGIGLAGAAICFIPDGMADNIYLRTQVGLGYEQLPIILNGTTTTTTTNAVTYPLCHFGLEFGINNRHGISFQLNPYTTLGINKIINNEVYLNEFCYGVNGDLFIGRKWNSIIKLFTRGGYEVKQFSYDSQPLRASGTLNYNIVRYGGGIIFRLNKKKSSTESFIKPAIIFETPSFPKSGIAPTLVGNIEIKLKSFITLNCTYSKNYFVGGDIKGSNLFLGSQNYFCIKIIKTGLVF